MTSEWPIGTIDFFNVQRVFSSKWAAIPFDFITIKSNLCLFNVVEDKAYVIIKNDRFKVDFVKLQEYIAQRNLDKTEYEDLKSLKFCGEVLCPIIKIQ